MFTRRLHLKLLAPTVLVSLALVVACGIGVLYLNSLHLDIARDLTENVQSTQAAARLEGTTGEIMRLLHSDDKDQAALVEAQNAAARHALVEVQSLANRDKEKELVPRITRGFDRYLEGWEHRKEIDADKVAATDAGLADLLYREVFLPCTDLRKANTDEVQKSDEANRAIVQRLTWVLLAVGLGAPLSGLLLGYAVARGLHHSIYQLSVHVRNAAGRLTREPAGAAVPPGGPGKNGDPSVHDLVITLDEHNDLHDLNGQMKNMVVEIERVVGELQQREREVLRAEQMAAVGQVAAGIAHELRNPLTSVKMLVQTGLEGPAPPGLPPDDLGLIEHEVRRMEQTIQTFLDMARPPRSERRRADLGAVVHRALLLVEGRARRQRVTLEADVGAEPVCLDIDAEQIHQVLVNLLLNALDALPRGGKVSVALVRPAMGGVEVRVQDSGPGIAPRIRERLFQPFVSSKDTGLGLGLSICRRLIEAHGGTIRGENVRGGGALFAFTLPGAG
jgi:two-component system, NtrC family, sensor histidine kinase HydH